MAIERIIDAPTAQTYSDDSYILIDGETNGTRKILISNLNPEPPEPPTPPTPTYLYNWDFTESLIDSVQGEEATLYQASRTSSGVSIEGDYGKVRIGQNIDTYGKTVEIDIAYSNYGEEYPCILCILQNNSGYRIMAFNSGEHKFDSYNPIGIFYAQYDIDTTDKNFFSGSTVKFVFGESDGAEVYKNDVYVGHVANCAWGTGDLYLGNIAGPYYYNSVESLITGVRIYETNPQPPLLYKWDFTQSTTDEIGGVEAVLTNASRNSSGLSFDTDFGNVKLVSNLATPARTIEVDIASSNYGQPSPVILSFLQGTSKYRIFYHENTNNVWAAYAPTGGYVQSGISLSSKNLFSGSTLKFVISDTTGAEIYKDGVKIGELSGVAWGTGDLYLGNIFSTSDYSGKDSLITEVRIY